MQLIDVPLYCLCVTVAITLLGEAGVFGVTMPELVPLAQFDFDANADNLTSWPLINRVLDTFTAGLSLVVAPLTFIINVVYGISGRGLASILEWAGYSETASDALGVLLGFMNMVGLVQLYRGISTGKVTA